MFMDNQLVLHDDAAITATAASTNYIDLGPLASGSDRDIGRGKPGLEFIVLCTTAALSTGASTVTVALQTDDNTSFSSPTTLLTSAAIAKASVTAGSIIYRGVVPPGVERYLRAYFTVATADLTAGKFSAFLVQDGQNWKALADSL